MNTENSVFTNQSQNAINKAVLLTKQCHYAAVEPQVMMVAVLQEGNDMVPFLLNQMGVNKNAFFTTISNSIAAIPHANTANPPFSDTLKNVLQKAKALSDGHRKASVGLEYLFWAFVESPNVVNSVMRQYGITPQKMATAVQAFQQNHNEGNTRPDAESADLPNLNKYGVNLIRMAQKGKIEPAIGRDEEIRRILQIISRKTKNNPVLVGDAGTGKTAIVEGLAHRIIRGDVPQELRNIKLYALDIASLIAGAQVQGEFEQRLKKVIQEASSNPNIVLFIDEIHLMIGAGKTSGAMDAANILKPELARGTLKIIGATTVEEYRQYIEKDKAFERRFQKVVVDEPDVESAISILRGIKGRFERHHHVKILDEAIVAAVKLSHRYIADRFLPDKAIDLIDEAASSMRIDQTSEPHDLEMLKRQLRNKEIEKESLLQDGTSSSSSAIRTLDQEIANLRAELAEKTSATNTVSVKRALDEQDIMRVVTAWTGIPMTVLTQDENDRLLHMEEHLHRMVVGQNQAVKAVSDAIRRNRMGLGDANRPIGTFLFLGPTGVGKTEVCKALANYLFNNNDMMVRVDMSEYQQEHSVARLFGAPPGYVGYDQGGQLTEAVRRKPYSVVLFDEIEKAHPKVFETLLQVLDEGRMTDGQGRLVNFKNTIIIMTSNLKQNDLRNRLAPEFINRIDEIITFLPLSKEEVEEIVVIQLNALKNNLTNNGMNVSFDSSVIPAIAQKAYNPQYGARPVKRTIKEMIVDQLSMALLRQEVSKTRPIKISYSNGQVVIKNH